MSGDESEKMWAYIADRDAWFRLKEAYLSALPRHADGRQNLKRAAEELGMPFHTFRKIGKNVYKTKSGRDGCLDWVPLHAIEYMLAKAGEAYEDVSDSFYILGDEEKRKVVGEQMTSTFKDIYGQGFFSDAAKARWERTNEMDRRALGLSNGFKYMSKKNLARVIERLSSQLDIDPMFLRAGLNSYRGKLDGEAYDLFCSEEEKAALFSLGNGKTVMGDKLKNSERATFLKLNEKGIVKIRLKNFNEFTKKYDVELKPDHERVRELLRRKHVEGVEDLARLSESLEAGVFICDSSRRAFSPEKVVLNDYKCPDCGSDAFWDDAEDLRVLLKATVIALNRTEPAADFEPHTALSSEN